MFDACGAKPVWTSCGRRFRRPMRTLTPNGSYRSIKHERLARMVPLVGIRGSVNISERRGRSASAGASLGPYLGHYAQAGLAFMPLDLRPHLLGAFGLCLD